jgi:large subunit ribosomal protein L4
VVAPFAGAAANTTAAAAMLRGLGAAGRTLLIDVRPDAAFALSVRNIAGVRLVPSGRVTARDVMDAERVIATRAALERLQEVLA